MRRLKEPLPKPVVARGAAWNEVREAVLALHGNVRFWAQRDSAQAKFNALFRNPSVKVN